MTTDSQQYQGWTNWDTWDANLWLTNERDAYLGALDCADQFQLQGLFERTFAADRPLAVIDEPARGYTGFIDGVDPARVNWDEIYQSLHEGEGE